MFRQILEKDPENKKIRDLLTKETEEKLAQTGKPYIKGLYDHVKDMYAQGRQRDAKKLMNMVMKIDTLWEQAWEAYSAKDYQKAEQFFQSIVDVDKKHQEAKDFLERVAYWRQLDQSNEASTLAKDTNEDGDSHQESSGDKNMEPSKDSQNKDMEVPVEPKKDLYEQGKAFYRKGRFQDAAEAFEQLMKESPAHPYAGRYYRRSKRMAKDVEKWAIDQQEPKMEDNYKLAKDLYRKGKYKEAIVKFEKVVKEAPGHQFAMKYLEDSREKLGRMTEVKPGTISPTKIPASGIIDPAQVKEILS